MTLAFLTIAGAAIADVRLVLDETSVLPGTPTGLTIVVSNERKVPLRLPSRLWLVATDDAGQTFMLPASRTSDGAGAPVMVKAIAPGAKRELRFDPTVVVVASPWLLDGRLSRPGTYRLKAVFATRMNLDGTYDAQKSLTSNEVTLTVAASDAEDALVWRWMRERGGGQWDESAWMQHASELADFVAKNHPDSQYALYTSAFLPMRAHGEPAPQLAEAAQRYASKPFARYVKELLEQYRQQR